MLKHLTPPCNHLLFISSLIALWGVPLLTGCNDAHLFGKKTRDTVQWLPFNEAIKKNRQAPKKVMVDVYTDWCGYCKKMDKEAFRNPDIARYINRHFYPVKLNAEKDTEYVYQGEVYSHQTLVHSVFHLRGYPTLVYLDKNNDIISVAPGYRKANEVHLMNRFFAEDHYKDKNWQNFKQKRLPDKEE